MGLWHPSQDSSVGHPHPWQGVVMKRTHCRSPSDTQLRDASIRSRSGLSPKGCRTELRAPGETQPCVQGEGPLAVAVAGLLHQQGCSISSAAPKQVMRGWGPQHQLPSPSCYALPAGPKPLMLQSSSALEPASAPSLNTKVSKLNSDCEYLPLPFRADAEETLAIQF